MYMLEMRSVAKVFRTEQVETHALRSLDLHVREGEFVAVTGPSGSGKSSLMAVLSVVALLAVGLAVQNLAARQTVLIPLIWLHAVLPGVVCGAILFAPLRLPRRLRERFA